MAARSLKLKNHRCIVCMFLNRIKTIKEGYKYFSFDAISMLADHGMLSHGKRIQTVSGRPDPVKHQKYTRR
jgi:hypothetical protein